MPACEKADVTIALEPLAPADTNFLNTAADAVALMDMVGSPHCRLHLDCKAMAAAEGTEDCLRKPGSWIPDVIRKYRGLFVHFHANDPNLQGPGFGKLDFVPIMKALHDINYRGWVSVEVFDYTPGPERLTRREHRVHAEMCRDDRRGAVAAAYPRKLRMHMQNNTFCACSSGDNLDPMT